MEDENKKPKRKLPMMTRSEYLDMVQELLKFSQDNKITNETFLKWLEDKHIIRKEDNMIIVIQDREGNIQYPVFQQKIEQFQWWEKHFKDGTASKIEEVQEKPKDDINADSIPF